MQLQYIDLSNHLIRDDKKIIDDTSPVTDDNLANDDFETKKSQTDSLPQSKLCLAEKHEKLVIKIMIPKEFFTDRLYPSTPQPTVSKFVFCSFSREFI